jgi:S1-C subfamily serine protease
MDASVAVPRSAITSIVFLETNVPATHPSASILGEERLGAGVAIGPDRVVTAHYLVMGATSVQVAGVDGKPRDVQRVTLDHETGLALILLEGPPLMPAVIGPSHAVSPGLPVFLLTCTGERERKGATGHVSAVGPFEAFWEYMLDRAIMTTAINPGLAGAPLFDPDGRVIGIVSLGLAAVGRYSLAIPMDLYLRERRWLEGEEASRAPRAWIGFYPQGYDGGVVLSGVIPGGPADKAGLERGDLVLSVEGQPVSSLRELYRAIWCKQPGESVGFQILRESSIRVVDVVSGDRYEFFR